MLSVPVWGSLTCALLPGCHVAVAALMADVLSVDVVRSSGWWCELEWEFKLRPGVVFSDGSPFTAEDVMFSFDRVRSIPNNPNPYTSALRTITGVTAPDPTTLRITTATPNPKLPSQLRNVSIVSRIAAKGAMPSDFASGRAAVGTGPFRFMQYLPGDR